MDTPDFPLWAGGFSAHFRRLRRSNGATLHQLEALFGSWVGPFRLAPREEKDFSRQRCWTLRLVFWTFLWQVAQAGSSCREAIRQAQSLCQRLGHKAPPDENSPYCTARAKLPLEQLDEIHRAVVADTEKALASKQLWCGLTVRLVDATTVLAADTPQNQAAFPQHPSQKPGCGFPILRLIGLFSLATGLFLAWSTAAWGTSELAMLQSLWEHLRPGQLLVGDRAFGNWVTLAQCLGYRLHGVFRLRGHRRSDWRRGKRLSKNERLVQWAKPANRPPYLSQSQWAALPELLTLRLVRVFVTEPGFRTRRLIVVTTLLDSELYPPSALAQLYRRRWNMELSLRHLKTTLQMEQLSCKTPNNLQRELWMHFCIHNLVRRLMFEAAAKANVPLDRISFAGALAATRRYAEALLQARTGRQRKALREQLYRVLAADLVPERPARREPRAVKKRPKSYPRLSFPRRKFRQNLERRHSGRCKSKRNYPNYRPLK